MPRRPKRPDEAIDAGIPRVYEGPAVLSELLARAGSPYPADEVAKRFRRAQSEGAERSEAIPSLFPSEPRFGSPDEARRLYSNLFGLWKRVAAGLSASDDTPVPATKPQRNGEPEKGAQPETTPEQPVQLPPRGSVSGRALMPDVVEAVWKHLDGLTEREQRRLHHRFESAQPDLHAWLEATPLSEAAAIAAQDLVFETWAMFDVAFGDRVGTVPFAELRALADEPPAIEASQPALADYVAEVLDLLAEEDQSFGAAQRAQVERVLATVVTVLGGSLAEE
jgi:hypothetical protein